MIREFILRTQDTDKEVERKYAHLGMTMLSFHNDPAVKEKYLQRVEAHRLADEIVQGTGFERNGKVRACAVGCTLDAYDHDRYPIELGLPLWLARLEEAIHEGVPLERAKLWPGQFLAAIPVGVDVEKVQYRLAILRHEKQLVTLADNKEPYAEQCRDAIAGVIAWLRGMVADSFDSKTAAWSAARSAAWSAVESAAWSAARSAAWSAVESAAWSAESAESAAESAAARSAESAARSAWPAAARSASWEWEADALLKLLREAA